MRIITPPPCLFRSLRYTVYPKLSGITSHVDISESNLDSLIRINQVSIRDWPACHGRWHPSSSNQPQPQDGEPTNREPVGRSSPGRHAHPQKPSTTHVRTGNKPGKAKKGKRPALKDCNVKSKSDISSPSSEYDPSLTPGRVLPLWPPFLTYWELNTTFDISSMMLQQHKANPATDNPTSDISRTNHMLQSRHSDNNNNRNALWQYGKTTFLYVNNFTSPITRRTQQSRHYDNSITLLALMSQHSGNSPLYHCM